MLVSALTQEAETGDSRAWLVAQESGGCAISDWVMAEFSAALSIKLRTRQIDLSGRAAALATLHDLVANSLVRLPIMPELFLKAASFADQYALGLRAGDALHLAICAEHGVTLCTLDRRLAEAGGALGVSTQLL